MSGAKILKFKPAFVDDVKQSELEGEMTRNDRETMKILLRVHEEVPGSLNPWQARVGRAHASFSYNTQPRFSCKVGFCGNGHLTKP